MKLLFLCALIVAGVFVVQGAHELCALNNAQIKAVLKCMGDNVNSELKGKAKEIIQSQGDNLAELVKRQCSAGVDFVEVLKRFFSDEEANAVRQAYSKCKNSRG
ncbi:uncharacterized protein LOC144124628 [Amblyomma americanum]|uniref:Antimicrobial peptide microplusin n=2 Tax=Amblyomma americanum TaxID=6943 RepID=A0AAQ4EU24_AMBAM